MPSLSPLSSLGYGYDLSVRSPVRTDAGGGGRRSEVNLSGKECVIAEVKFSISRTSFVSVVNHMAARTFREREKKNESFFPLNINIFINLDNRERARARNK